MYFRSGILKIKQLNKKIKIIKITTLPISLNILFRNQFAFLKQHFDLIGISSYDDKHLSELKKREGIQVIPVNINRMISPFNDIISIYKLYKVFKKEKPLIVHTHTPKAGLVGIIAARIAGVPYRFHTIAGLPFVETNGIKRILLIISDKVIAKLSNTVYYNSVGLKKIIVEHKLCNDSKLKMIGNGSSNGIDTEYFSKDKLKSEGIVFSDIKKTLGFETNDFIYCFVGRIVKDKGVHELVSAFTEIADLFSKNNTCIPKLLLVGPIGNDRDSINQQTQNLIDQHQGIKYVGRQDDIRPFLAISNVFVFPSYREGFPNVVLQAGAMGIPSIVSDINGNNEIILHKKNGLIIPSKDKNALKNAMLEIIENVSLLADLSQNARELIISRYEQALFHKQLLDEYLLQINKSTTEK